MGHEHEHLSDLWVGGWTDVILLSDSETFDI